MQEREAFPAPASFPQKNRYEKQQPLHSGRSRDSRPDGLRRTARTAPQADEHPLHHDRRPHVADDELLRRPLRLDPESRPDRRRGRALHEQLRGELAQRPQPRLHAHREAFAQERILRQHHLRVRRLAADLPQTPPQGRIRNGHRREMASRKPPDGLRPLGNTARAGRLLQPRLHPADGRHGALRRLYHEHHHRQEHRVARARTRPGEALLSRGAPQGTAPQLDGRHVRPRAFRGPHVPRAGDLLRRLRRTSGSRRTGDVHRLEPRHGPDIRPQNAAAGPEKPPQRRIRGDDRAHEPGTARGVGPLLRADRSELLRPQPAGARTGRMEVHPLHARLPQNAQIPRRQRGTAARLPRGVGTRREHPHSVHLRPGILHGRARLVRQAIHVRGVAADPARDADAGRCEGTDRGDGPEHRLRPHVPRAGRSARTRGHSGPVAAAPAAGRTSGRLERVDLLPFLRIPGRAHGETPLRSARRTMEADTLLRRHRRVGTLRPRSRSPRTAQSLRKSGLRRRAGADDEGAGETPDAVRRHGGDGKERILRP